MSIEAGVMTDIRRKGDTLTKAQRKALALADADKVLQIGGIDGRDVRWIVAERLVSKGMLVRVHTPIPGNWWWGYRLPVPPVEKASNK